MFEFVVSHPFAQRSEWMGHGQVWHLLR